ncbi:MAG: tRNA epoxyqueuosine(34) reductase QueG [Ignavibacteria bacterium]|nr:tRNA epoxyqueuosine(34) reductase QueG [Ignavibacteria bacterium]
MNITNQSFRNSIISKAKELGFFACGFAKYEVLEDESQKLRKWLDEGKQAEMTWIERGFDKRKDIRQIMPEAKSVISLAYNYYTPFEHDESKPKISRYAWGKDYHKILKKKLKELCEFISKTSPNPLLTKEGALDRLPLTKGECPKDEGVLCRAYVDDGPVMDKVWAQRAGIGWMGKHTNIINPDYGSWFFLSEIITNIDFGTYDTPIEDMCGSCTLCISACPTGAIESEYVVNANKCISYQTIENRGEIPADIDLDGWIFGCDVCQDVCPFNSPKYNHVTEEKGFYPKPELLPLTKEGAIEFTEEQFAETFADSPVKRTKYKGWKRNLERF